MTVIINLKTRPPSTNNLFIGVGKRRIRSPDYKAWATSEGWELQRQRPLKTQGMVSLLIEVQEPETAHKTDIDNKSKAAIDLLVEHRLIESDDQFTVRKITLQWSSEITGTRISISPWAEEIAA